MAAALVAAEWILGVVSSSRLRNDTQMCPFETRLGRDGHSRKAAMIQRHHTLLRSKCEYPKANLNFLL